MAALSLIFCDFPPSDRPEASKTRGSFSATWPPLSFHKAKTHSRHSGRDENDPNVIFAVITMRFPLTTLKEKLIKIGAKVVTHAGYITFQLAEVAIPGNLFADILRMITELRPPSFGVPSLASAA
jgi:hypothetical protein